MRDWKDETVEVRDTLIEWLINNGERRLVEEAEDILDGLEERTKDGEMGMTEELLLEATEIVTSVVIAWNMDLERVSFMKDGQDEEIFQMDGSK